MEHGEPIGKPDITGQPICKARHQCNKMQDHYRENNNFTTKQKNYNKNTGNDVK